MPGQQLKSTPEFMWLEALHIERVSSDCVQWYENDYTLRARAQAEILACCEGASESTLQQQRLSVLDDGNEVVWEIQKGGVTTWITFDSVQSFERPSFAQEITLVVELFHRVMVQLPKHYGTRAHMRLVAEFCDELEDFLDHYRGLDQDDVIRFVSKTGPKREKVERDLAFVLDLYDSSPG